MRAPAAVVDLKSCAPDGHLIEASWSIGRHVVLSTEAQQGRALGGRGPRTGRRTDAAAARRGANVFPNFLGYLKDSGDESFKRRGYFLKARARRRPLARRPGARHAAAGRRMGVVRRRACAPSALLAGACRSRRLSPVCAGAGEAGHVCNVDPKQGQQRVASPCAGTGEAGRAPGGARLRSWAPTRAHCGSTPPRAYLPNPNASAAAAARRSWRRWARI